METEIDRNNNYPHVIDLIYDMEMEFIDDERRDNTYYIGIYHETPKYMLLGACISPQTFYRFSYPTLINYLFNFNIIQRREWNDKPPKIEILKTTFREVRILSHGTVRVYTTYQVIVKTFWLKIFQIKWRNYYIWKMTHVNRKKRLQSQRHFEIWGKYPTLNSIL